MAQLPIPNRIDDSKDECGGAVNARVIERIVLEAHLPDGLEPSRLVLLFFGGCWVGTDALGGDEGFFLHLEVVCGEGNDAPKVVLRMCFIVASLE